MPAGVPVAKSAEAPAVGAAAAEKVQQEPSLADDVAGSTSKGDMSKLETKDEVGRD